MKIIEKWNKFKNTSYGTLAYIVIGFLIALTVNNALAFALKTDTPVVAVFSNSMVPTFYQGDILFVRNYNADEKPMPGDIIIFESGMFKYPIIHRIISVDEEGKIQTKGDNNPVQDPWTISQSNIHGKAILKVPALGWIKISAYSILGV